MHAGLVFSSAMNKSYHHAFVVGSFGRFSSTPSKAVIVSRLNSFPMDPYHRGPPEYEETDG